MEIKDENYFVIQGWMVSKLNLSGNELLVFAIIYCFSQKCDSWYCGSISYICDFIGCKSKNTVLNILKSLQEKKLIEKEEYYMNNVKFCKYKVGYIKNCTTISIFDTTISKNEPNNNNIKEINNNKLLFTKKDEKNPTLEEIQAYCLERNNNVDAKKFYDYYSTNNWKDKDNKPVKNWKQKMIANWEKDSKSKNFNSKEESECIPLVEIQKGLFKLGG